MANNELMQGLLSSLLQPQQQQGPDPAAIMAAINTQNPMASVMAMQAPSIGANVGGMLRQAIGGRGGIGTMTAQEAMAESIGKADLSTAAGLTQAAQNAMATGNRPLALQFTLQAQQKKQEEQTLAAQTAGQRTSREGLLSLVEGSSIAPERQAAVGAAILAGSFDGKVDKLLSFLYPEEADTKRFTPVGGTFVWDNEKGTWAEGAGPSDAAKVEAGKVGASIEDALPGFDADKYDPTSVGKASTALSTAQTAEERTQALSLLKPAVGAGEEWRTVAGRDVIFPVSGAPKREMDKAVSTANGSRRSALRMANNFVDIADGVLSDIASGKTSSGAATAFFGYIPGTSSWDQRVSVDTLKANLGIDSLAEARRNSVDGSSGFGQLTTMELQRLEDRIRSLSIAQSEEQFVENLRALREEYASIISRDGGEMTQEDYIGIPRNATVTTPSGRYVIEEMN
jgi:hypothetical protein